MGRNSVSLSCISLSRRMSTRPKRTMRFNIVHHAIFYADYARKIAVTGLRKNSALDQALQVASYYRVFPTKPKPSIVWTTVLTDWCVFRSMQSITCFKVHGHTSLCIPMMVVSNRWTGLDSVRLTCKTACAVKTCLARSYGRIRKADKASSTTVNCITLCIHE